MVGAADVEQNIGAPRQTLFHASAVSGLAWLPEDTEDNHCKQPSYLQSLHVPPTADS